MYLITVYDQRYVTSEPIVWNDIIEEHPVKWLADTLADTTAYCFILMNWQEFDAAAAGLGTTDIEVLKERFDNQ